MEKKAAPSKAAPSSEQAQIRDLKMAILKLQQQLGMVQRTASRAEGAVRRAAERIEKLENMLRRQY